VAVTHALRIAKRQGEPMDSTAAKDTFEVRLTSAVPLRGVVSLGDRDPLPFEGWVELAAAVQSMMTSGDVSGDVRAA
jgi:hypothetical protein